MTREREQVLELSSCLDLRPMCRVPLLALHLLELMHPLLRQPSALVDAAHDAEVEDANGPQNEADGLRCVDERVEREHESKHERHDVSNHCRLTIKCHVKYYL